MYEDITDKVKLQLGLPFDTEEQELLELYVSDAVDFVNEIRDFTPTDEVLYEPRFSGVIKDMVVETFQKRGAEGTESVSLNGTSRSFASTSFSPALIRRIPPMVRIG